MKFRHLLVGVMLVAALVVAGCGSSKSAKSTTAASSGASTASGGATTASTGTKICAPHENVALIDIARASSIEAKMDLEALAAMKDLGWNVHFTDAEANFPTIETAIMAAVQAHDNLIITESVDQGPVREGLLAAKAAHIPVIEVGGGISPSNLYSATYNENEHKLGYMEAEALLKAVPHAQIADLSTTFNYPGVERQAALEQAVAATHGAAKIVDNEDINQSTPNATQKTVTDMLTAHPTINAVFTAFDNMAVPAAATLRAQNSKAKLFTNFASASNLALVKSGSVAGLVDDNLAITPDVAIDQFLKHVKTGAAFNPNALAAAGGLHYRIVTTPNESFSNAATLAPFLKKWQKEFPCS